jgi:flagellar hook-associated protein 3 FlgL
MPIRVSTNHAFQTAAAAIVKREAEMLKTQQQLATGQRIASLADDPLGAARALQVDSSKARNDSLIANQAAARHALSLAESTLGEVTGTLQNARELLVSAGNGAYSDAERRSLAGELRMQREHLLGLANTRDADGRYLFAGYQERTQPFVETASGVAYQSDGGRRELQVASSRTLAITASGADTFASIRTGNGVFATSADPANGGNGVVSPGQVADPASLDGLAYDIVFRVSGGVTTYDVIDAASSTVVSAGNAYQSGAAITVAGMQAAVTGAPADGDRFTLAPSVNRNIFDALSDIIGLLETAATSAAQKAQLSMGLSRALGHVDATLDRVLGARAEAGAGLNELDALEAGATALGIGYSQELSEIRDLDYAKAASDLALQQTGLDAAQKAFVRVMGRSLFDLL